MGWTCSRVRFSVTEVDIAAMMGVGRTVSRRVVYTWECLAVVKQQCNSQRARASALSALVSVPS